MKNRNEIRAAIYCRVSTDEQRERQTIENQVQLARQFCERQNLVIYDFYRDDGITGTIPLADRPAGKQLLEDAGRGVFDTVLVKQIDRLGRDALYILNAAYQLETLGVQVRSILEHIDLNTPQGKFMLTIHSGVAALERDTIVQRSIEGTNRLAREGVWLGGIVPYGYCVVSKDREARLIPSDQLVSDGMTEADVVRLIYRLSADEGQTCVKIAAHLNTLGIPPAYVRDGREVLRGKRKAATAGIWSPSRIRNLITNTTYMGLHRYGRRSRRRREIIERAVPAIVDQAAWERAQQVLHKNLVLSTRNAKHQYLLRGLMRCGLCGLTYGGVPRTYGGKTRRLYRCNGKTAARGRFGQDGKRCPSALLKDEIEGIVWHDIEGFLRDPGAVLSQLSGRMGGQAEERHRLQAESDRLGAALRSKQKERDAILGLYRRGRIDDQTLDRQLDEIDGEERQIRGEMMAIQERMQSTQAAESQIESAKNLLETLNAGLDQPLSWDAKRDIVETLVDNIRVDTVEVDGKKSPKVEVTYAFSAIATRTDTDSSPQ